MKKRLDTDAISNELEGASLFFRRPQETPQFQGDMQPEGPNTEQERGPDTPTPRLRGVQVPRRPGTQASPPRGVQAPRHPDAQTPRRQDAAPFELSAKAEERQTLRLSEAEFRKLGAVQGMLGEQLAVKKVDKNDILRCGLHALFEDYEKRGEQSELVRQLRKKYR